MFGEALAKRKSINNDSVCEYEAKELAICKVTALTIY